MDMIKKMVCLILCLMLVGCQNQVYHEEVEDVENEKKTIHFMHLWSEELYTSKFNVINEIVNDYMNEHPNIIIKVEILDNEQYKDKLKIVSTSNSLPDVGVTWAAGALKPYVEGKLFTALDSVISDELNENFIKGTTDAFKIEGKTYGLPLEFNIAPIYYNKAIFEQYQLSPPKTYDELVYVIKVLNANGITPIALGNKERWTGSMWYLYLAERFAGPQVLTSALAGHESFMNDELLKAATEVQTLVNLQAFNKNFNGLINDDAKTLFYEGQAAMYLMGTWELGNFTTNPDIPEQLKDSIGFFKFPYEPFAKGNMSSWIGGPGVGLFVAENSQVKEEAKEFVAYFVKEWGKKSVEQAGVIPATKVDTRNLKLPKLYIDILSELKRSNSLILYADVQLESDAAEQHLNQIQALFGLAVTPEQFNMMHDSFLLDEEQLQ